MQGLDYFGATLSMTKTVIVRQTDKIWKEGSFKNGGVRDWEGMKEKRCWRIMLGKGGGGVFRVPELGGRG